MSGDGMMLAPSPEPSKPETSGASDAVSAVPDQVAALARKLPVRLRSQDKTEGYLLIGDQVVNDPIVAVEPAGRLRSRRIVAGKVPLAGEKLNLPVAKTTIMDHVESQAAWILRKPNAPKNARLVLNNSPCDDPDRPFVCRKFLASIIPGETTIVIYVTNGTQTWHELTIHGTGEEISE
jgi:hypothetical protein